MAWIVKGTIINWRDRDGKFCNTSRRGHWQEASIRAAAQRFGWALPLNVTHYTSDMNGYPEENDDATDEYRFVIA